MDAPIKQVPRPTSSTEPQLNESAFVIQRNTLTLYLSFAAIILSCASAGVNLFTFYAGGQQKMLNEADQVLLKVQANRVLQDLNDHPGSHPVLTQHLDRLYKSLIYRPPFDAKLTVYERAAFGLVVEAYAAPMTGVQQQLADTRMKLVTGFMNGGNPISFQTAYCLADPFAPGCPVMKGVNDEDRK